MTQCVRRGETCWTLGLNVRNIQGDKAFKNVTDWKLLNILKLDHRQENSELFYHQWLFFYCISISWLTGIKLPELSYLGNYTSNFFFYASKLFFFSRQGKWLLQTWFTSTGHDLFQKYILSTRGALIKTLLVPNLTCDMEFIQIWCTQKKNSLNNKHTVIISLKKKTKMLGTRREEKGQVKRVGKKKNVRIVPFFIYFRVHHNNRT